MHIWNMKQFAINVQQHHLAADSYVWRAGMHHVHHLSAKLQATCSATAPPPNVLPWLVLQHVF
jgi:hypothetical protein